MHLIFLVHIAFQSSDRVELDFSGFVIKMAVNVKSRGNEKIQTFLPRDFQILGNETLIIAHYEYATIFMFAMLDIKMTIFCINFEPLIE